MSHVHLQVDRALREHPLLHNVIALVVSGGVASNKLLRAKLKTLPVELIVPEPSLCVDSGVMGQC